MSKTRHIEHRMSERGTNDQLLQVTQQFAKTVVRGDVERKVLNCKNIDQFIDELDAMCRNPAQGRDIGGVVLVSSLDDIKITTYRLDSFKRGHAA